MTFCYCPSEMGINPLSLGEWMSTYSTSQVYLPTNVWRSADFPGEGVRKYHYHTSFQDYYLDSSGGHGTCFNHQSPRTNWETSPSYYSAKKWVFPLTHLAWSLTKTLQYYSSFTSPESLPECSLPQAQVGKKKSKWHFISNLWQPGQNGPDYTRCRPAEILFCFSKWR